MVQMKISILLLCFLIAVADLVPVVVKGSGEVDNDEGSDGAKEGADTLNPLQVTFTNSCIEDLGCFYTGGPFFSPPERPISLAPVNSPKPKFLLFTDDNRKDPYLLEATPSSLQNSKFDPNGNNVFFIHDFQFKLNPQDSIYQAKDELLKLGPYNVFIVDWTDYNDPPYEQAVANSRVIGAVIAKMIRFLMKEAGISPEKVHLVGHGLGAHIAGYAGERIEELGRITGLDPACPYFQGTDPIVRLDPTDADFVDIIHTNGAGLGMTDAIGHMDFYPNGGSEQPGCANATGDEIPPNDPKDFFGKHKCDHMRALKYFRESVYPNCHFQAVKCNSYANFQKENCGSPSIVSQMGMYAKKIPRLGLPAKFFLKTSAEPPYCLG